MYTAHTSLCIVTRDGHANADICINFCIIRQYRAISNICIAKNIRMAIPNCHGVYCTVSQAGGLRPSG